MESPRNQNKSAAIKGNCNFSLYFFCRKNRFRVYCWRIVSSKQFEWGIILLIILSTLMLAVDTYYLDSSNTTSTLVLNVLNYFFTICFALEAVMKIVTYGFVLESSTYLREAWNVIDLIALAFSFMDFFGSSTNMKMFRVLRLLRVFRTLRYLSGNNYIKVMFKAVTKSLGALCNALILLITVFIMFSIVGVHFFSGRFQYCSLAKYEHGNEAACVNSGGEWLTYRENFDNVVNGLIYLFGMTGQEGWADSIHQALDCTDVNSGPIKNAGWFYGFYYIVFIFVGPIFLMKLFVGIMFYNFKKAYKDELENFKGIVLTQDRLDWIEIQKFILHAKPDFASLNSHKPKWRAALHFFVTNFYFELFMAAVIVLNTIELAIVHNESLMDYPLHLRIINVLFLSVYTVEVALKMLALGVYYWYRPWNVFEFVSVMFNCFDIAVSLARSSPVKVLRSVSEIMRILRLLRISRIFKLLRRLRGLQTIIQIVQICLLPVLNLFALTAFIFFIYAILGCYLFYDVPHGVAINQVYNFSNFGKAIVLVLNLASGENANQLMFECARVTNECTAGLGCGHIYAYVYFFSFRIVVNFVMLNLFVLVVLYFFDKHFVPESHNINAFKANYDTFKSKWASVKPKYWGNFIHINKLLALFKGLPPSFEFETEDVNTLSKYILGLRIMRYTRNYP